MYGDMPDLVDSRDGERVMPGGFGSGIPQQQPFGPNATPALGNQYPQFSPEMQERGFGGPPPGGFGYSPWHAHAGLPYGPPPGMMPGFPPPAMSPWAWPQNELPPAARTRPQAWNTPQGTPYQRPASDFDGTEDFEDRQTQASEDWLRGDEFWGTAGAGGWGAAPLRRTRSAGAASSAAEVQAHNAFVMGYASGPRSKYNRPEEWRRDFSFPKAGALTRLLSVGRGSPNGKTKGLSFASLLGRPELHWSLDARERSCSWDIRIPPANFKLLPDQRPLGFIELQESAVTPPAHRMRLIHPLLPWYIPIDAMPGTIITVAHVLDVLYSELQRAVNHSDFWNDDVSEKDRNAIHMAWAARCQGDVALAQQGIKRVDFLCNNFIFEGLKRSGDDWEMRMKPAR